MKSHGVMNLFMKDMYVHGIISNKVQKTMPCVYYECNYFSNAPMRSRALDT